VGNAIENALAETVKSGKDDYVPKYTLGELLDQSFRLPAPPRKTALDRKVDAVMALKAMAKSTTGVKVFKGKVT
jgi:hypothetical protein